MWNPAPAKRLAVYLCSSNLIHADNSKVTTLIIIAWHQIRALWTTQTMTKIVFNLSLLQIQMPPLKDTLDELQVGAHDCFV